MDRLPLLALITALFVPFNSNAVTQAYGPLLYLSEADSPFTGLNIPGFQLEDFDDGLLNTVGVALVTNGTVIGPQPQADSVDGDAGGIDGTGADGRSLLSTPARSVACRRTPASYGRMSVT